jgi:uracil-DNA glycosylase
VRLMVVGTNPGQPQPREDDVYYGKISQDLADAAWSFTENTLLGETGYSRTLDPLLGEIAFLLDCSEDAVLDQCVFTNHVKCSTPKSFSNYNKGEKARERRQVSRTCILEHLKSEIDYWSPDQIVVFSATARDAMLAEKIKFDGYISHPTALGRNLNKAYRHEKLQKLKIDLEALRRGTKVSEYCRTISASQAGTNGILGRIRSIETPIHADKNMTKIISSHKEFGAIKPKFPSASEPNFRKFKKNYSINPDSKIELTGMPRDQALRNKSGDRWDIFGELRPGVTVAEFFQSAKKITSRAERDHDMFIALHKGFIRLIPEGKGTELCK